MHSLVGKSRLVAALYQARLQLAMNASQPSAVGAI